MIGPDQDWVDEQRREAKAERKRLHAEWHRKQGVPCSGFATDPYCIEAEKWAKARQGSNQKGEGR